MQFTGIIRRIDDLGRVSIPKEIRRELRIREGDALECYINNNGEIAFRKYSSMECVYDLASQLCDSVYKNWGYTVIITDKNNIVATSNSAKKLLLGKRISEQIKEIIYNNGSVRQYDDDSIIFIDDEGKGYTSISTLSPIVFDNEVIGCVLFLGNHTNENDIGYKTSKTIATFLSNQMNV